MHIYEFRASDKEQLKKISPFKSKYFSIGFSFSGTMEIQVDLVDYYLSENDIIIINTESLVEIKETEKLDSMLVLNFMPELLTKYQFQNKELQIIESILYKTPTKISLEPDEIKSLNNITLELKKRNTTDVNTTFQSEIIYHLFMAFIYELSSTAKSKGIIDRKISRTQQLSYDFLKSIKQYCHTERTVAFYADQLHITPNHLSDSVKKTFGKSAMKLINETTVLALKVQFSNPNLTIAQIADEFSFSSLQHLSQFYKNHTGLSPLQYRKQLNS